jgi:hypothetical protein
VRCSENNSYAAARDRDVERAPILIACGNARKRGAVAARHIGCTLPAVWSRDLARAHSAPLRQGVRAW